MPLSNEIAHELANLSMEDTYVTEDCPTSIILLVLDNLTID